MDAYLRKPIAHGAAGHEPNAGGEPTVIDQGPFHVGQRIVCGKKTVVVDRFLAAGGFAYVYLVSAVDTSEKLALKRVAIPDDAGALNSVRQEVAVMKKIGSHKNVVRLVDYQENKLPRGSSSAAFEMLILMEYCSNGHVVDLMNRFLQVHLREDQILAIFSDVCEAVAHLHYQNPPIAHRDLKVENILIDSGNRFKLCDYGSCSSQFYDSVPRKEIPYVEEEISKNTTLQYRSPEQCDLYLRYPLSTAVDIWALGVLLYKLCFYTTPFETTGQLAILNAKYTLPNSSYSPDLLNLIKSMLTVDPRERPNVYVVLSAVCKLRKIACPIQNKYTNNTAFATAAPSASASQVSAHGNNEASPSRDGTANIFDSGMQSAAIEMPTPMRRGRPKKGDPTGAFDTSSNAAGQAAAFASSSENDPFAFNARASPVATTPGSKDDPFGFGAFGESQKGDVGKASGFETSFTSNFSFGDNFDAPGKSTSTDNFSGNTFDSPFDAKGSTSTSAVTPVQFVLTGDQSAGSSSSSLALPSPRPIGSAATASLIEIGINKLDSDSNGVNNNSVLSSSAAAPAAFGVIPSPAASSEVSAGRTFLMTHGRSKSTSTHWQSSTGDVSKNNNKTNAMLYRDANPSVQERTHSERRNASISHIGELVDVSVSPAITKLTNFSSEGARPMPAGGDRSVSGGGTFSRTSNWKFPPDVSSQLDVTVEAPSPVALSQRPPDASDFDKIASRHSRHSSTSSPFQSSADARLDFSNHSSSGSPQPSSPRINSSFLPSSGIQVPSSPRAQLSQIAKTHDPKKRQSFVEKAVNIDGLHFNRKYGRRVLLEVWRSSFVADNGLSWVYDLLIKMNIAQDPTMTLKASLLLHKTILEGPRSTLREHRTNFIDDIKRIWSSKLQVVAQAPIIVSFADYLIKRLHFHRTYPDFEGSFSLDNYYANRQGNEKPSFLNTSTVKDLLAFYDSLEETANRVTVVPLPDINEVRFWVAISLVEEAFSIFSLVLYMTQKLRGLSIDTHSLMPHIKKAQTFMTIFFATVSKMASLVPTIHQHRIMVIPKVPETLDFEKAVFNYPPSCELKFLRRLERRQVDISRFKLSDFSKHQLKVKERALNSGRFPLPGSRYFSDSSSDSE